MRPACWLGLSALLTSCYLSPDTHLARDQYTDPVGATDASAPLDASDVDADAAAFDAGCANDQACGADAPVCLEGRCTACKQHEQCGRFPTTPACGPFGACVPCSTDKSALCVLPTPACDPTTSQCVQCVADSDCTAPQRAACRPDRTCGVCSDDAACARFGQVCDLASGTCVTCRPSTEQADCRSDRSCDPTRTNCPGTACDPQRNICTSTPRGSRPICNTCVSDSECVVNHRCIPLFFGAGASRQELGGFCMKVAATNCTEPFRAQPIDGRSSLSGHPPEPYCGFNEGVTSCAAILALQLDKDCPGGNAQACDAPGARCATVNFGMNECTYGCMSNRDCPPLVNCGGPMNDLYCGGH